MKIIADNKIPYLKGVLEPLANIEYYPGKEINAAKLKNADALIIRTRTKCDKTLLSGSSVKYIATATIGFDHIDTAYCDANNIQWTNAPGCNSGSVMQYMASALIRIAFKHNFSLSDKTIGIVGVGHVGSKVAKLATALGIKVLLNDPPRERIEGSKEFVSLEEIQKNADIISFHVPLNLGGPDKTYRLFNKDFLNGIKNEAVIINTSRGEIVSEKILKEGLKNKRISAAVLDVWENEPEIDEGLLKLVDIQLLILPDILPMERLTER